MNPETFRIIFDNSPVAITLTDSKERIISWNKYTEKLLGYKKDNFYLKPVKSLYPEKEWKRLRRANIRQEGMRHHFETQMIKKNGKTVDVDISIRVLKDKDGKLTGSIGIIRDITERKRTNEALVESEERYRTIFDNSAVAITLTDEKERIISWNKYAEELYGRTRKDAYMKPVRTLYPKREWLRMRRQNIRKKGIRHHYETKCLRPNGQEIDIDISISIQKDASGKIIGSIGIARDITERKKAERMLRSLYEEKKQFSEKLKKEVKERTKELKNANQEIKRLLQIKTQFLGQVSHDLRTPLTSIGLMSEVLQRKIKPDHSTRESFDILDRNVKYLNYLVKDVLNYVSLETGRRKVNATSNNVGSLVREVMKSNDVLFKSKNIKVTLDIQKKLPSIYVDRNMMMEVLQNLISNSVHYMKESMNRKLDVTVKRENGNIFIEVKDTGIGINKKDLETLFHELFKLGQYRGGKHTGMGLSICRKILGLHEGRIWAESPGIGKGASIKFILPIKNKFSKEAKK